MARPIYVVMVDRDGRAEPTCYCPDYRMALMAVDSYTNAIFRGFVPDSLFPKDENPIFHSKGRGLPAEVHLIATSINEFGDCEELEVVTPAGRVGGAWVRRVNIFIEDFLRDKSTPLHAEMERVRNRPLQITGV